MTQKKSLLHIKLDCNLSKKIENRAQKNDATRRCVTSYIKSKSFLPDYLRVT